MKLKKIYTDLLHNFLAETPKGCLCGQAYGLTMLSPDGINAVFLRDEPFPFDLEKMQHLPEDFIKEFLKMSDEAQPVEKKGLEGVLVHGKYTDGITLTSAKNEIVVNKKYVDLFDKDAVFKITDREFQGRKYPNYAFVYEADLVVGMIAEIVRRPK